MDYDVVIATRNRPEALRLSIPSFLTQSRPPRALIVVDASEDHTEVCATIRRCVAGLTNTSTSVTIVRSPANVCEQRNRGVEIAQSPIVMLPDDDSVWWPGVADSIMRVYERDVDEIIGGVCAAPASALPPRAGMKAERSEYQMTFPDVLRTRVETLRRKFDNKVCPDPFWIHGRSRWPHSPMPEWFTDENVALVEYMGGFRMSFRREVLRDAGGFDPILARYSVWPACEDADASFKVAQTHLLVGAQNAKVHHYRFPGGRGPGFTAGAFMILNRAYILKKYAASDSNLFKWLRRFGLAKMAYYMAELPSQRGRQRIAGVAFALRQLSKLEHCDSENLINCYIDVAKEVLARSTNH